MIYEKDWLMRQIKAIAALIWSLLTGRPVTADSIEAAVEKELKPDGLYPRLSRLLGQGEPGAAEDLLFAAAQDGDEDALAAAMLFYIRLSRLTDGELASMDFSREEILEGLRDIGRLYGLSEGIL